MQPLLYLIADHMLFLFSEFGFKFRDSEVEDETPDGRAWIHLENSYCQISFSRERAFTVEGYQNFLTFRSLSDRQKNSFTISLIRRYLTNAKVETGELTPDNIQYFVDNAGPILECFKGDQYVSIRKDLMKLAVKVSREIFPRTTKKQPKKRSG